MSRTVLKLSLSVAGLLVAGLLAPGAASAAPTGEDGDCAGMTAPAAHSPRLAPPAPPAPVTSSVIAGGTVIIHVLPSASTNAVVYTSTAGSGGTCIDSSGAIEYFADMGSADRTDSFVYGMTDGDNFVQGTVTVTVTGVIGVNATVIKKARNGAKAKLSFTNANDYAVRILAGSPTKRHPDVKRTVAAHSSTVIKSRRPKVFYVVTLTDPLGTEISVSFGTVTTSTGKVKAGNFADQQRNGRARRWAAGA